MLKTLTWYDNGWGYATRVVELMERMAAFTAAGAEGEGVEMSSKPKVAINGFGRIGRACSGS